MISDEWFRYYIWMYHTFSYFVNSEAIWIVINTVTIFYVPEGVGIPGASHHPASALRGLVHPHDPSPHVYYWAVIELILWLLLLFRPPAVTLNHNLTLFNEWLIIFVLIPEQSYLNGLPPLCPYLATQTHTPYSLSPACMVVHSYLTISSVQPATDI